MSFSKSDEDIINKLRENYPDLVVVVDRKNLKTEYHFTYKGETIVTVSPPNAHLTDWDFRIVDDYFKKENVKRSPIDILIKERVRLVGKLPYLIPDKLEYTTLLDNIGKLNELIDHEEPNLELHLIEGKLNSLAKTNNPPIDDLLMSLDVFQMRFRDVKGNEEDVNRINTQRNEFVHKWFIGVLKELINE